MKATYFVSWSDAPHLTSEAKTTILAGIPPWQREARTLGIPALGSGAIYQVPPEEMMVTGFPLPKHWPRCFGLDVGWKTNALLWAAWDRDTDTVYIYDELYRGKVEPSVIAASWKTKGDWIPGVIDPAANGRSQKDGAQLLQMYSDLGMDLLKADNTVEAGIFTVWERLSGGRLKIFNNCVNTLAEYRLYRRDKHGKVVKKADHAMDALRYLIMSGLDRAIVEPKRRPGGGEWWAWDPPQVWAG